MANRLELEQAGRCWVRNALPEASIGRLRQALDTGLNPGNRLDEKGFAKIAPLIAPVIEQAQHLLPNCRPVRALVFNKSTKSNWAVGWHQDRVIAVREKHKAEGFTNWTQKSGIWHCEPPIEILENMMFARVHLDESTVENGCLEVVQNSHKYGRVSKAEIPALVEKSKTENCVAKAGDVLFAKALISHRSKPSTSAGSRSAIRVDFSNYSLKKPLYWAF